MQPIPLSELSLKQKKALKTFLPAEYHRALDGKDPWEVSDSHIAAQVILDQNHMPIALALATCRQHIQIAEILALYVAEEHRNQGIGTFLLSEFQKQLHRQSIKWLACVYSTDSESYLHFEKICRKLHWNEGELFLVRSYYMANHFHQPWVAANWLGHRLAGDMSIVPWKKISNLDLEKLDAEYLQGNLSTSISPKTYRQNFEKCNSLALRKGKKIVGWILTQKVDSDTIKYRSLYIEREYRHFGYAITLLAAAIRLQQASKFRSAIVEINVQQADRAWLHFVKKRALPSAYKVERLKRAVCELKAEIV